MPFQSNFSRGAVLLGGLSVATVSASALGAADQIETPDYEVIATEATPDAPGPKLEVRQYAPMIVAEVTVQADSRHIASQKGFRPLADYIFGNNRPQAKIAMTAPVTTQGSAGSSEQTQGQEIAMTAPVTTAGKDGATGSYTVRFTMPSAYTRATLPEPVNPAVRLIEVKEQTLVALRFTGRRTDDKIAAAEAAVTSFVEAKGLTANGPFITAGYDGPRTAPEDKRWEVQRPIVSADPLR